MRRFYSAGDRIDAYLLLHRLQRAGIAAHVFNEHMSSIVGDVPPDVAQPQVWLESDADLPRAEAELSALETERSRTGVVFCPVCHDENPANFEVCWQCGSLL